MAAWGEEPLRAQEVADRAAEPSPSARREERARRRFAPAKFPADRERPVRRQRRPWDAVEGAQLVPRQRQTAAERKVLLEGITGDGAAKTDLMPNPAASQAADIRCRMAEPAAGPQKAGLAEPVQPDPAMATPMAKAGLRASEQAGPAGMILGMPEALAADHSVAIVHAAIRWGLDDFESVRSWARRAWMFSRRLRHQAPEAA